MAEINTEILESAIPGYANGISTFLNYQIKNGIHQSLSKPVKEEIIKNAAVYYGEFLTALGVNWEDDPNSKDTPMRVAKAYVNDLWYGRYNILDKITTFPSDNYKGIVLERDIPIHSICSHHHQTISGNCHIAYIPSEDSNVLGLSKLNRLVNHFSRRGAIQEQLTIAIHKSLEVIIPNNSGIIVIIHATHNCVSCRGVRHVGTTMITSEVSGSFADHSKTAKAEVFSMLNFKLG